jgi:hypothetical protein
LPSDELAAEGRQRSRHRAVTSIPLVRPNRTPALFRGKGKSGTSELDTWPSSSLRRVGGVLSRFVEVGDTSRDPLTTPPRPQRRRTLHDFRRKRRRFRPAGPIVIASPLIAAASLGSPLAGTVIGEGVRLRAGLPRQPVGFSPRECCQAATNRYGPAPGTAPDVPRTRSIHRAAPVRLRWGPLWQPDPRRSFLPHPGNRPVRLTQIPDRGHGARLPGRTRRARR